RVRKAEKGARADGARADFLTAARGGGDVGAVWTPESRARHGEWSRFCRWGRPRRRALTRTTPPALLRAWRPARGMTSRRGGSTWSSRAIPSARWPYDWR